MTINDMHGKRLQEGDEVWLKATIVALDPTAEGNVNCTFKIINELDPHLPFNFSGHTSVCEFKDRKTERTIGRGDGANAINDWWYNQPYTAFTTDYGTQDQVVANFDMDQIEPPRRMADVAEVRRILDDTPLMGTRMTWRVAEEATQMPEAEAPVVDIEVPPELTARWERERVEREQAIERPAALEAIPNGTALLRWQNYMYGVDVRRAIAEEDQAQIARVARL